MRTDATGAPLVVQTLPASQHEVTTMLWLVVNMPAVAGKPGRPRRHPAMIVADKAFDDKSLRSLLHWRGIEALPPKCGEADHGLGVSR